MNYTVHVPENFEFIDQLKQNIIENNLTMIDTKSFKIDGPKENIDSFKKFVELHYSNDIFVINNKNKANCNVKSRIVSCKKINLEKISSRTSLPSYFSATELAKIYEVPNLTGARTGIAIIELGGGYKQSDLTTYWNYLKLATIPNVYSIGINGASNQPGSDADAEVTLDIEIIGGMCPNSNIYVYFAPNTDQGFYDAINAAINNTANPVSAISISWGAPENYWSLSTMNAMNSLFQSAASKGISVCVACGDNGSSDGESTGNHADFPASSPWVLACGGTRLTCPNRIYSSASTSEIVWGTIPGNGATGGGFSTIFTRPSYQIQALVNYPNQWRGVPDVCGNADPASAWLIYLDGNFVLIGGTSAVAPMWSAYLASIKYNKFINTTLYSIYATNESVVHDITVGNNGAYSAAKNWDPASGLGSLSGTILTQELSKAE